PGPVGAGASAVAGAVAGFGSRARAGFGASASVGIDPGIGAALTLWRASVLEHSGRAREAQAILDTGAPESGVAGSGASGSGVAGPALPMLEACRAVIGGRIDIRLGRPLAALRRLAPHRDGRFAALADVASGRAYLAAGDVKNARQSVRRVLTAASAQSSRYVLVDAMLLDARISERERDAGRALEMITSALDVARGEFVLPFAEAREELGGLLARHPGVAGRWPAPPVGDLAVEEDQAARHCPVSLTQRERSVLAYLATSMTAGEIAAELYLSLNTVKTHLGAIYRKLGVGGRREAVRRARELELLLASRRGVRWGWCPVGVRPGSPVSDEARARFLGILTPAAKERQERWNPNELG
ncbi:MAG: helix-turn-helix transcriptional regulator, partial [Nocardiopsaceae bacterium]|nr:helix-turn-helix transcriptional regulator [Nocardiopsaceae bacterium]